MFRKRSILLMKYLSVKPQGNFLSARKFFPIFSTAVQEITGQISMAPALRRFN